ncbi:MAG: hypothetical protein LBQ05_01050, partial [Christensenellaceae bacterium]|nr:hypothetical protein [Christensenellaceae bacterium]
MGIKKNINKTVLCIVDGFGSSTRKDGNAVLAADMKNFNTAFDEYPSCYIKASGKEVGLDSDKDAGNSEVGHNAIGSGQIIKQGLSLLNEKYKKPNLTGNDTPATNDTPEIFKQALKATNDTPEIFMPALVGNDTPAIDAPPEIFQTEV